MTPTPDFSENRRSFVKKTLATTITISFAGLIRAHGEGTTGTTWNPDETTAVTTDSGGTTTWNPDETTNVTTGSGDTTTWNPDETSIYTDVGYTTWNPDETTEYVTSPPPAPKPGLYKSSVAQDPAEINSIQAPNENAGVIEVTEDKGGGVLETRYKCNLRWNLEFKVAIPDPAKSNNVSIIYKNECLSCSVSDVKLAVKVETITTPQSGAHETYRLAIENAVKKALDQLYNDQTKAKDGSAFGSVVTSGVSATALEENGQALIDATIPQNKTSPDTSPVQIELKADVPSNQIGKTAVKDVTWTIQFSKINGFNADNFKALCESEVKNTVAASHGGQHKVTTITMPKLEFTGSSSKVTKQQSVTAGMTVKPVQGGAVCPAP